MTESASHLMKRRSHKGVATRAFKTAIVALAIVAPALHPFAASASNLKPKVQKVSFSGDKYWELTSDDGETIYKKPQFEKDDDTLVHNYSVAYTADSTPKIKATFKVTGLKQSEIDGLQVKAEGTDGVSIPETDATAEQEDTQSDEYTITLDETPCSTAWPNEVKYYDRTNTDKKPFELEWSIKIKGKWVKAGTSKHTVYVTLADPVTSLQQESLFYIGCRDAADSTSPSSVVTNVWFYFGGLDIKRVDGVQMVYWNPPQSVSQTLSGMLLASNGNGSCVAWSDLFKSILEVQGISGVKKCELESIYHCDPGTTIYPDDKGRAVMLIKYWSFTGNGTATSYVPFTYYTNEYHDYGSRVMAQGNSDSPSNFFEHFIIKYKNEYYDPSYGVGPIGKQLDWENGAFSGFEKKVKLNTSQEFKVGKKKNQTTEEVIITEK